MIKRVSFIERRDLVNANAFDDGLDCGSRFIVSVVIPYLMLLDNITYIIK